MKVNIPTKVVSVTFDPSKSSDEDVIAGLDKVGIKVVTIKMKQVSLVVAQSK